MNEQRILDRPDAFRELLDALERSHGDSGNGGRGNDGGDGGGDDGPDYGPFGRLLLSSLRQMGEMQIAATLEVAKAVTAQVVDMAGVAARGDEVVAKTLTETISRALDQNAEIAAHVGSLAARVHALEAELAQLRAEKKATLQ